MIVFDELNTQTRELTIIKWYEEVFPIAALYIKRKGGELNTCINAIRIVWSNFQIADAIPTH